MYNDFLIRCLMTVLLFFSYANGKDQQKIFRISEGTSMFMPAVEENGQSHRYDFIGDCVITSISNGPTGVKLGYNGTPSYAGVITKQPIDNKPFRIDIRFIISKGTKGDGLAFWLTSSNEFKKGNLYGREPVDGLLLAIDLKGNTPFIGINYKNTERISSFHKTEQLKGNIFDNQLSLRILYENESIVVSIGRNNNFTDVFQIDDYTLPEQSYFAISTKHTTGFSPTTLFAIRQSNIEYPSFKPSLEKERPSKRGWVWAIFIIGLVVLVVTVGKKQFDNFKKNN
ncbi:hypothetical protein M153_2100014464 [Pseudoloma neurophilia]|uniref:L-type lectin-like domain-containing protein n=1 Tax=Pseudoloma neurophilia TaxID=146866 RepID=A0A0R0M138_9MICR|nr:hypothetical protein M153_2100014464 [Pseudoloma neurophilia]